MTAARFRVDQSTLEPPRAFPVGRAAITTNGVDAADYTLSRYVGAACPQRGGDGADGDKADKSLKALRLLSPNSATFEGWQYRHDGELL